MSYFIVEYDRRKGQGEWTQLAELQPALDALGEKERAKEPHVEVVLFMADSLDELRTTHSRYFMSLSELMSNLRSHLEEIARSDIDGSRARSA